MHPPPPPQPPPRRTRRGPRGGQRGGGAGGVRRPHPHQQDRPGGGGGRERGERRTDGELKFVVLAEGGGRSTDCEVYKQGLRGSPQGVHMGHSGACTAGTWAGTWAGQGGPWGPWARASRQHLPRASRAHRPWRRALCGPPPVTQSHLAGLGACGQGSDAQQYRSMQEFVTPPPSPLLAALLSW